MKKRWTIMAGIVSVMMLAAACGTEEEAPEPPVDEVPTVTTLTEGVLTVGSDIPFPPFEFREEETDELIGYDVELVEEIASRLGLTTEWLETDFDTIFTQLAAARFDIVASATTITEEREEIVNFSIPYYLAQQSLSINSEETPDIQSVEDLREGDTVAVQRGTTGEDWARDNLEPDGIAVRSFPDAPDTYTALEAGNVTAVIFDEPSAVEEAERRPALEVVAVIETGEEYGFPVNPENQELLDAINQTLQAMMDDGTYATIYDRWFPGAPGGSVA